MFFFSDLSERSVSAPFFNLAQLRPVEKEHFFLITLSSSKRPCLEQHWSRTDPSLILLSVRVYQWMLIFHSAAAVRITLRDEVKRGREGGLPLSNTSSSINTTLLEIINGVHVCPVLTLWLNTASHSERDAIRWNPADASITSVSQRGTGVYGWHHPGFGIDSLKVTSGKPALPSRLIITSVMLFSHIALIHLWHLEECYKSQSNASPPFYLSLLYFYVPFWSFGEEMKVADALVSSSPCEWWFPSLDDIPRALRNAAWPRRGGKRTERWLWVARLFTGSPQIRSVPHMVWIIAAEPYKWIQHAEKFGAPTNVWSSLGCSSVWEILVSFASRHSAREDETEGCHV